MTAPLYRSSEASQTCIGAVSQANNCLRLPETAQDDIVATNDHGQVWWHSRQTSRGQSTKNAAFVSHVNLHVRITACAIDANGRHLYLATTDKRIVVVDVAKKRVEFDFGTNLSEPVALLRCVGGRVYAAAEATFAIFEASGEEVAYMMISTSVLALHVLVFSGNGDRCVEHGAKKDEEDCRFVPLLANKTGLLTVVNGQEVPVEFACRSVISCIVSSLGAEAESPINKEMVRVLIGTVDGQVLEANVEHIRGKGLRVAVVKRIQRAFGARVNVITVDEGSGRVLTGMDDGTVNFHSYLARSDSLQTTTDVVSGSIRGIQCCSETRPGGMRVWVCTHNGQVYQYSHVPPALQDESQEEKLATAQNKLLHLSETRTKLSSKLQRAYKKRGHRVEASNLETAVITDALHPTASFALQPTKNEYLLTCDLPVPFELFVLQSTAQCKIVSDSAKQQHASRSDSQSTSPFHVLTAYRFTHPTNQFRLHIRTSEGSGGVLRIQLVTATHPKTAHQIEIPIKPLSLHVRDAQANISADEYVGAFADSKKPFMEMLVEGAFSLKQIHDWVDACLPGVPALGMASQTALSFTSVVLGTTLEARYEQGTARFTSDSPLSIAVVRDVLLSQANARNIKLKFNCTSTGDIAAGVVATVELSLKELAALQDGQQLVSTYAELRRDSGSQDEDALLRCFSAEDQKTIRSRESVQYEDEEIASALEAMHDLVVSIADSLASFTSKRLKPSETEQLRFLLSRNDFPRITDFLRRVA